MFIVFKYIGLKKMWLLVRYVYFLKIGRDDCFLELLGIFIVKDGNFNVVGDF